MRIAFYAPLKSPDHPVPSGDRQMARMLVEALGLCGHEVDISSRLRAFSREASDAAYLDLSKQADAEIARLRRRWASEGPPDAWFCYHPYYKAADLIGPPLTAEFSVPYVTAESSYSSRRNEGAWKLAQEAIAAGARQAAVNICFTERDRKGLDEAIPEGRYAMLPPFIDTTQFEGTPRKKPDAARLIAVAMMRPGDKLDSYRMLAAALEMIVDIPWTLTVVGDGPTRPEVQQAFAGVPEERLAWAGENAPEAVAELLFASDLYVWPGCGEAYGLSYLEAQAAGLPVVAQATAGVPEVVRNGDTGLLTAAGDIASIAEAIRVLLGDAAMRAEFGNRARRFVLEERSLTAAARRLDTIFGTFVRRAG
ncbi:MULTISPECIES: glycosyltransferase family 4 protein [Sinorhizobium]|uniref:Glycosyl transferase n=1 Tax=Sinorhizobium americanum TaxID=194963 RepID=A0A2S3YRV5_9HYPH|nr:MULTISPECIES: glycosyltransferase family 4 protein [Sinorhizobium]PDT43365.1 glycosyl transferase [Sinorhizobium sp. FG01]POH34367.1 glycosyl transferase [Sinorhizobium americanum]